MKIFWIVIGICCLAVPALAQQPAAGTPDIRRLAEDWTAMQALLAHVGPEMGDLVRAYQQQGGELVATKKAAEDWRHYAEPLWKTPATEAGTKRN